MIFKLHRKNEYVTALLSLEKMAHISHKEFFSLNWVPIKDTLKTFDDFKNKVNVV